MSIARVFRTVPSRLGAICFSRAAELRFSYHDEKMPRMARSAEMLRVLSSQPGDTMLLMSPQALPLDIEKTFKVAEQSYENNFAAYASNFFAELQNYCKAIGFCTSLELQMASGVLKPLSDWQFKVPSGIAWRSFFGGAYDSLAGGRVILVAPEKMLKSNPIILALRIAYELGELKLYEQWAEHGRESKDIANDERQFFAYNYLYNFSHYLLKWIEINDPATLGIEIDELDMVSLNASYEGSFSYAMQHFNAMSKKQKRNYMVGQPRGGLVFGQPFIVEILGFTSQSSRFGVTRRL